MSKFIDYTELKVGQVVKITRTENVSYKEVHEGEVTDVDDDGDPVIDGRIAMISPGYRGAGVKVEIELIRDVMPEAPDGYVLMEKYGVLSRAEEVRDYVKRLRDCPRYHIAGAAVLELYAEGLER